MLFVTLAVAPRTQTTEGRVNGNRKKVRKGKEGRGQRKPTGCRQPRRILRLAADGQLVIVREAALSDNAPKPKGPKTRQNRMARAQRLPPTIPNPRSWRPPGAALKRKAREAV